MAGWEVRLAGLDAPEWDQKAKHRDGYWFNHGKRVKSALIDEIGGKHIRVAVEGTDRFGRLLGTVTHKGSDVGEWLVREGHAIAAYSDRLHARRAGGARGEAGHVGACPQLSTPGPIGTDRWDRNYSPSFSKVRSGRNRRCGADGKGLNPYRR